MSLLLIMLIVVCKNSDILLTPISNSVFFVHGGIVFHAANDPIERTNPTSTRQDEYLAHVIGENTYSVKEVMSLYFPLQL